MKKKLSKGQFFAIGILIIAVLLFAIFILIKRSKSNTKNDIGAKYIDKTCGISFDYPKNWTISNVGLPLSQKPLSEVVFNELGGGMNSKPKNSILTYICYDAKKYSFNQLIDQNTLKQGQTEVVGTNSVKWQRAGNFAYATKNDKLVIFQMFFTKYDLKPKVGYEEMFLAILTSFQ